MGDRILMLENSWYSVISPESCSQILWRSWDYKEDAAQSLKLTAPDLMEFGIIDRIITEPEGGAHRNPVDTIRSVGTVIEETLAEIGGTPPEDIVRKRIEKFEHMGSVRVDQ